MSQIKNIFMVVLAWAFAGLLAALLSTAGCGHLKSVDEYNNPSDDAALKKCREEGRSAKDAGASSEAAYEAYFLCTKDAGLR